MSDYYQIALTRLDWLEVTMWFRNGQFNHIEDGHNPKNTPRHLHESHVKAWSGKGWQKYLTYMTRELCPKVFYP